MNELTLIQKLERNFDHWRSLYGRRRTLAIAIAIGFVICISGWVVGLGGGILLNYFGKKELNSKVVTLSDDNLKLSSENKELRGELNVARTENNGLREQYRSLNEVVAPLIKQATEKFPGEDIKAALKKVVELLQARIPENQPIRTGAVTVETTIKWGKKNNGHYMDRGAVVAIGKGHDALAVLSSVDSFGRPVENDEYLLRAVCQMDATDRAVGKPIASLREGEYIQVKFLIVDTNTTVKSGKATFNFNGSVGFELLLPPQQMRYLSIFAPLPKGVLLESD